MIFPMNLKWTSDEKEFELSMVEDIKRLEFWITGAYRDYYDLTNDTTPKALKIAKRIKYAVQA